MGRETAADAAPVATRAVAQAKATRRSSRSRPSQGMLDNVECTLFHSRELQGRKQAGGCTVLRLRSWRREKRRRQLMRATHERAHSSCAACRRYEAQDRPSKARCMCTDAF